MASTRLPGKVLMEVAGSPMLAQQIRRVKQCAAVDEIVVATTTSLADAPIVELARSEGVGSYTGSEDDVLGRFSDAARVAGADVIVRLTADCPLIDPGIVDTVVGELVEHPGDCDYASNVLQRTYPRGLDAEAFFWDTLLRMDRLARSREAREHVTILPRSELPQLFLCRSIVDSEDNSDLRWTVDAEPDLLLVRTLYQELGLGERVVPYGDVLAFVRSHRELGNVNAGIETWSPPDG